MKRIYYLSITVGLVLIIAFAVAYNSSPGPSGVPGHKEPSALELSAFASVVIEPTLERFVVDHILILPQELTLIPGQKIVFNAVAQDSAGEPIRDVAFEWRVKDPLAGTITSQGLFTAGSTVGGYVDTVEVTAFSGRRRVAMTASVAVVSQQGWETGILDSLEIYPSDIIVGPGEVAHLSALGLDEQGRLVHDIELLWSMGDPEAGSVDRLGIFTASRRAGQYPGAVVATATQYALQGTIQRQASIPVTVGDDAGSRVLSQVVVVPSRVIVSPGEEVDLFARALDEAGQPVADVSLTWQMAEPAAGRIDQFGHFVAGARGGEYSGAIQVGAIQQTAQGVENAEGLVSVVVVPSEAVYELLVAQISPSTVTLRPGQVFAFTVAGLDTTGNPVPINVSWDVTNPQAGSILESGLFTVGYEPGVYTDAVRVQLARRGEEEGMMWAGAYATVNILGPLKRLELRPSTVVLQPGESIGLRAIGYDDNGVEIPKLRLRWSMVDANAGTIDQAGTFTAGTVLGGFENAITVTAVEVAEGAS